MKLQSATGFSMLLGSKMPLLLPWKLAPSKLAGLTPQVKALKQAPPPSKKMTRPGPLP